MNIPEMNGKLEENDHVTKSLISLHYIFDV